MQNCETCAYFKLLKTSELPEPIVGGECRRWPPVVVRTTSGETPVKRRVFPIGKGSDWCGEHRPRLVRENATIAPQRNQTGSCVNNAAELFACVRTRIWRAVKRVYAELRIVAKRSK